MIYRKKKRSIYRFVNDEEERNRPINRTRFDEVEEEKAGEGSSSEQRDPSKFFFDGKEEDIRDYENFKEWTPQLDMIVIDSLYEDFVNKNMKQPYRVCEGVILTATFNIMRKSKILVSDTRVERRVRSFIKAVKAVKEITQLGPFQWCEEKKKILGDEASWRELVKRNVYYVTFWNLRLPYYEGKLVEIFSDLDSLL